MKKILASFLTVLLAVSFAGCGTYVPPVDQPDDPKPPIEDVDPDKKDDPVTPGDEEKEEPFTVALKYRGDDFWLDEDISAYWNSGIAVYAAEFDGEGKASIDGLDGDYRVTLSDVPYGYTYNPNIYTATNDKKNVEVELYSISKTSGSGTDLYGNIIELKRTGMYRASLTKSKNEIFYSFNPTKSGIYSIESWVNTTEAKINPYLDVYYGSNAFRVFAHTIDGGGLSSGFTKNFRYEIEIDEKELGNTFAFAIRADLAPGVNYPVDVDFALMLDGSFSREWPISELIVPQETYRLDTLNAPTGRFTSCSEGGLFLGAHYAYDEETGFWRRYDAETDTFGQILYAKVAAAAAPLPDAFSVIEYAGNKALTIDNVNYKLFIEGYSGIKGHGDNGDYFGDRGLNEADYKGVKGYANYCVNGVCAVTMELKVFLQAYAVSQRLFNDGNGLAEASGYGAAEDDQWLFACGYYL